MLKGLKHRLYPTDSQKELIAKHIGCSRFVYNLALETKNTAYLGSKHNFSPFDLIKQIPELKKECEWLKEVNSQSLQQSIQNMDIAFKKFFKGAGFPKYKSKHKGKQSFSIPQNVSVNGNKLMIPKFKKGIEIVLHREIKGTIKSATISVTPTGKYFVSILVDTNTENPIKAPIKEETTIGIDLGIKDFVITSEGYRYKNNRYTKTYAKKLKEHQQHLSRKTKGSNRYQKQKLKVATIYKKITNSRLDNLHKVSTELIKKYDLIVLEDLNIKGMIKNHKLSKYIVDASWSKFVEFLTYKAEWNDKKIVKIDRFFPSSKTCNSCGYINQNLKLDMREWTCPSCNTKLDRDLNASMNILNEGYKLISSGTDDYRRGDKIRPTSVGTIGEASKILNLVSESHESLVRG